MFKDCHLAGYRIPKGAMVVPVWWAMNLDPTLWTDPLQFRPERFLVDVSDRSGTGAAEWRLEKPDCFMPFQCGRRMCIGDDLGRTVVFLFTVTLLQHFRLSFPPGFHYDIDGRMKPEYGFTLVPHPYPVAITPRWWPPLLFLSYSPFRGQKKNNKRIGGGSVPVFACHLLGFDFPSGRMGGIPAVISLRVREVRCCVSSCHCPVVMAKKGRLLNFAKSSSSLIYRRKVRLSFLDL